MAEIVNLRQARKHKTRADKARTSEQNRAAFGRGKAERERDRQLAERAEQHLDGHRRDGGDDT